MKRTNFLKFIAAIFLLLSIVGCESSSLSDDSATTSALIPPTLISQKEVVVVSDEVQLANSYLFTTTSIEDNGLYILGKGANSVWYKVDTLKNTVVPTTSNYFIDEQLKPDLAQDLGVSENAITFFPSPSNHLILVHVVMSYLDLSEGTPNPIVIDGLTVPQYIIHCEIFIYDTSSKQLSDLGSFEGDISKTVWSPNENYVVISRNAINVHEPYSPQGNWIVNTQTGSISPIPIEPISGYLPDPRLISSDGTQAIFFTYRQNDLADYLLYDFNLGISTSLELIEDDSAYHLWWYAGEEKILYLVNCDNANEYSIAGFDLSAMQRMESTAECFNIERWPFVTMTTDSGRYLIYRHSDDPSLYGRTISIATKKD